MAPLPREVQAGDDVRVPDPGLDLNRLNSLREQQSRGVPESVQAWIG